MSGLKVYTTANSPADLAVDACNPLPPGTPDLSQFLVLTRRGTCLLSDKLQNLENAGAKVILYPDLIHDMSDKLVSRTLPSVKSYRYH